MTYGILLCRIRGRDPRAPGSYQSCDQGTYQSGGASGSAQTNSGLSICLFAFGGGARFIILFFRIDGSCASTKHQGPDHSIRPSDPPRDPPSSFLPGGERPSPDSRPRSPRPALRPAAQARVHDARTSNGTETAPMTLDRAVEVQVVAERTDGREARAAVYGFLVRCRAGGVSSGES